jgi:hypothetical protein
VIDQGLKDVAVRLVIAEAAHQKELARVRKRDGSVPPGDMPELLRLYDAVTSCREEALGLIRELGRDGIDHENATRESIGIPEVQL